MSAVFVDTGGWYAFTDRNDPNHAAVAGALREHRNRLVTSNFILDETLTLVRFRLGWRVAHQLGATLRAGGVARVERISPRDENTAWSIFCKWRDKSFSFTDCTSFALCQRLNVQMCLAIDQDFRSFGLLCIP